jgi:hypothetical protein
VTTLMATGIRLSERVALHCQSITGEPSAYQLDVVGWWLRNPTSNIEL